MTREELKKDSNWRKVAHNGGTYVVGGFYNIKTKEYFSCCIRDYDYSDCSRDDDELYYMPIDEEARKMYLHDNGAILEGDTVEVVKGRKVKIGTVGKVIKFRDIYDKYQRWVAVYAVLDSGESTNVNNCKLVEVV